jgi:hypothetical protein
MFNGKNKWLLLVGGSMILTAFCCMAVDTQPNGFGILTLWIAPPLLLIGLFLPAVAIVGVENIPTLWASAHIADEKWKHLTGLAVFTLAFSTYIITLEPTASLWDCSEFIASAYKLEVPHTPGTPLALLFGRLFSMLALGDVTRVAWYVNLMSAFFSASAVYLVYRIIYYFGTKTSVNTQLLLTVSAACGSLCLAFSDSFWFSAVEAETYGPACFFLLLLIWLILRGNDYDEPLRSRIFILIGYVAGLSYCVHPMCLLVLPTLPVVWYWKNRSLTWKSLLISICSGLALVFVISRFVAIGFFQLSFNLDLLLVNGLGFPFYSGAVAMLMIFVTAFWFLLKRFPLQRTKTLWVIFLLLGFLPYGMLFIRSNHNPPIDETNPEDLYMMKAYMNRESYPSSPLLFGPYYDAQVENINAANKAYYKDKSNYKVAGTRIEYEFQKSRMTILPRLYSRDDSHIEAYRQWLELKPGEKPTFSDNLKFMFTCQLGHMYMRYFLWNFVGRESDIQGSSWLKPWDRLSNGADERARNQYWMIPLFLGVFGAFYQYLNDRKGFTANMIFFLVTGLVLAVYLNSPPVEPRERDYIYVASYIAFFIWVGLSVLSFRSSWLGKKIQLALVILFGLGTPAWMCYQNFDDHDRSERTFQVDNAKAVLNSCAPNAVLFTGGDNDTFPLWYLQEVEGFRTDVRVMVLSYFNTDWYINQLRRQYYNSPPLKLTLSEKDYRQYGLNDVLYIDDRIKGGVDVKQYLALLHNEHPALTMASSNGDPFHILPTKTLKISTDMGSEMHIPVEGNFLEKNALAILDLIVSNDWNRPLYFNFTSMNTMGLELKPYLVQEGLLYRLTATRHEGTDPGMDKAITFKKLITEADYSNLANEKVNFNYEDYLARMITPMRQSFNALAAAYLEDGDAAMAEKVLNEAVNKLYPTHLQPSYASLYTANLLAATGKKELAQRLTKAAFQYYYMQIEHDKKDHKYISNYDAYVVRQSAELLAELGEDQYVEQVKALGL